MKQNDDSDVSPVEEVQDMLTAYLDEEARISHRRSQIEAEHQQLLDRSRANRRFRDEIAEYWWREIGEPLGGQPGRKYVIPLKGDPWIGSVCVIFEFSPASGKMRAQLGRAYDSRGWHLKPVRDPEIEWTEDG